MKVAVSMGRLQEALLSGELSSESFIKYVASLGVDGIELEDGVLDLSTIKPLLRTKGLEVATYVLNHNLGSSKGLRSAQEGLKRAKFLSSQAVRIYADTVQEIKGLKGLLPLAEGLNLKVCLENRSQVPGGSGHIAQILSALESPVLKHSFHMANYWLGGEDPLQVLEQFAEKLHQVRVTDVRVANLAEGEEGVPNHRGQAFVGSVIGLGEVPVERMLKTLSLWEYSGWLTMEFSGVENPRFGIEASLKNLRQFIARAIIGGRAMVAHREVESIKLY